MFYQQFTGVVRHLIILNVLVFIGSYVILGQESFPRMMEGDENEKQRRSRCFIRDLS